MIRSPAWALLAAPALIAAAPANEDLALVQKHLRSIQTMTAAFTQTDRNGKVVTGTLTLKQPGKIRFQYQKGVPILIVGDGKALTFIDYSVRQVQRWPIGSTPLGVLLNPDRDIGGIAHVVDSGDPRIVSIDATDPKHPEYGRINLVFTRDPAAPAGLRMEGWVALDSQNNRTTIRLSDERFNAPVSDGMFRWNDPRSKSPKG
ncbi:outer membrane lipoprotein carrier protein LolA [Sphingomonas sp. H39-1-10]|uniref:LolA family protein n=1 Tax=Sphingomonas TaxID=13687 RepID=UPI00087F4F4B|nr:MULTISPECIES: outer membrane lipoprotein carrier protein LolA [Sphingomonas]MDF0488230.1 outer membrane lipoprotein carrier protein LolA [Sphingomonas pollutisoli]SDA34082.1 Outer membrane lipoprotein-sorting protein [Sphingomonas sp. NFR15]